MAERAPSLSAPVAAHSERLAAARYENEQRGLGRIPVLKKVTTDEDRGAVNTHASFLRKPAGLPGGLSLIPQKE